jgi:hypothetical protein
MGSGSRAPGQAMNGILTATGSIDRTRHLKGYVALRLSIPPHPEAEETERDAHKRNDKIGRLGPAERYGPAHSPRFGQRTMRR